MNTFITFFESIRDKHGFNLDIYNSSITDWVITVGYKRTNVNHGQTVIQAEGCDCDLVFAKAQVLLKEWLLEEKGGY